MASFLIRADASLKIGVGHIYRTKQLATALLNEGHSITYAHSRVAGNLEKFLKESGFEVLPLPAIDHCVNRNEREHLDLINLIAATRGRRFDWAIVDHYDLGTAWENGIRQVAPKIMVIDDLVRTQHCCDLLLDQNLDRNAAHYQLPKLSRFLGGPGFALLDPTYNHYRERVSKGKPVKKPKVMVSTGGSDPEGLTPLITSMLLEHFRVQIDQLMIVLGPNSQCQDEVLELIKPHRENVTVLNNTSAMPKLLLDVDLVIGCAGSSCWERACLGTAMILFAISQNQQMILESLNRKGLARLASVSTLRQVLHETIQFLGSENRGSLTNRLMQTCDGLGVKRVSKALAEEV